MCFREEGGWPFYRKQKRRKSHIKPMWDSYLTKSNTPHEELFFFFLYFLFVQFQNATLSVDKNNLRDKFDFDGLLYG